jgi:short-subunit dehydrogenase
MTPTLTGRTVLITGASSGLGAALAQQCADRGANLVLVARNEEGLQRTSELAGKAGGIRSTLITTDLTHPDAPQDLWARLRSQNIGVDILINNAGVSIGGDFATNDLLDELSQLTLNATVPLILTRLALPALLERGEGGIINIASTAANQPMPRAAVYGASKAFLASFGKALSYEVRGTGVRVLTVNPGPTDTPIFAKAGSQYPDGKKDDPLDVAEEILRAWEAGKPVLTPGRTTNRINAAVVKFLPLPLVLRVAQAKSEELMGAGRNPSRTNAVHAP